MARLLSLRRNGDQASLNVPKSIAKVIPENVHFQISLTDEGILYKPVVGEAESEVEVPAWANTQGS